jgi:hypothetical protein
LEYRLLACVFEPDNISERRNVDEHTPFSALGDINIVESFSVKKMQCGGAYAQQKTRYAMS